MVGHWEDRRLDPIDWAKSVQILNPPSPHTCQSTHPAGFVANPKRFNVATTRAKSLMIIVGDPTILMHDPHWLALLHYVRDNNACRGLPMPGLPMPCLPMPELPPRQQQQPPQLVAAGLRPAPGSPRGYYGMQASGPSGAQGTASGAQSCYTADEDPVVRGMHLLSLLQAPGQRRPYSVTSAFEGVATRRHDA